MPYFRNKYLCTDYLGAVTSNTKFFNPMIPLSQQLNSNVSSGVGMTTNVSPVVGMTTNVSPGAVQSTGLSNPSTLVSEKYSKSCSTCGKY